MSIYHRQTRTPGECATLLQLPRRDTIRVNCGFCLSSPHIILAQATAGRAPTLRVLGFGHWAAVRRCSPSQIFGSKSRPLDYGLGIFEIDGCGQVGTTWAQSWHCCPTAVHVWMFQKDGAKVSAGFQKIGRSKVRSMCDQVVMPQLARFRTNINRSSCVTVDWFQLYN